MDKLHSMLLDAELDKVYQFGCTRILWEDVYLWFQAKRISKSAYREIKQRWLDRCESVYRVERAPELQARIHDTPFLWLRRADMAGEQFHDLDGLV